jgi:hypothetical protein
VLLASTSCWFGLDQPAYPWYQSTFMPQALL